MLQNDKRPARIALRKLSELAGEFGVPRFALLATLAKARVYDHLGNLEEAVRTFDECKPLIEAAADPALTARYFVAIARQRFRHGLIDKVEENLAEARQLLPRCLDSALEGAIKHRNGVHLAKLAALKYVRQNKPDKETYAAAMIELTEALWALLLAENYDAMQMCCYDLGHTLHKQGPQNYPEADKWLSLSLWICRELHTGRYSTVAQAVLAKIRSDPGMAKKALEKAEKTGNRLDLIQCLIIFGVIELVAGDRACIDHFVQARRIYLATKNYDFSIHEQYLEKKCKQCNHADYWEVVIKQTRVEGKK